MVRVLKHGHSLLVVLAVLAIAVAACSSSGGKKGTQGPAQSGTSAAATQSEATESQATESQAPTARATGSENLSGAVAALKEITSYRFSMTLVGEFWADSFEELLDFGGSAPGGVYTMSGTIVTKPEKAADITIVGIRMVEVGGKGYVDINGTVVSVPVSAGSSLADTMAPATIFEEMTASFTGAGLKKVGTEQKNGVTADRYTPTQDLTALLNSKSGLEEATWQVGIWIARDGGYLIGLSFIGTKPDDTVGFQMTLDLSNVNDPSNKVTAPAIS
jgi:hypothetical protein